MRPSYPTILYHLSSFSIWVSMTHAADTICKRWSFASALHDNTIYIYGGEIWQTQSNASSLQSFNTLTRNFYKLDLSNSFASNNAPFSALTTPPDPGPPKVANGTFWVDDDANELYLYGGAYQQYVQEVPAAFQLWSYNTQTTSWGVVNTVGDNVTRAALGASTYYKGFGYYRGGNEDAHIVPGFGNQAPLQLGGMLEYTFANDSFYNWTDVAAFDVFGQTLDNSYVDGVLVPFEFENKPYLLNFGGGGPIGTDLGLGTVYVYDITREEWFTQRTYNANPNDTPPNTRGACAVVNYAPDNTSINVYMYGGKNWNGDINTFVPSNNMYVLTIPHFTWISLPLNDAVGNPGKRQDHACHLIGSNMIVVGGRDKSPSCDNDTVYIFDTSNTTWLTSFDPSIKSYRVPTKITSVIGGNENGTAPWVSVPAMKPTDTNSPFYNIGTTGTPMPQKTGSGSHTSAGVIAGPIIGGIAAIAIGLGLVWWVKRRAKKRRQSQFPPTLPMASVNDNKYDSHDMGSMRSPVPAYYDHDPGNDGPAQLDTGVYTFPVEADSTVAKPTRKPSTRAPVELPDTSRPPLTNE